MADYKDIIYKKKDRVAIMTLNRPEVLNALWPGMEDEMRDAWTDFNRDAEARVLIITGAGRGFCSGEDVKELSQRAKRDRPGDTPRTGSLMAKDLRRLVEKPVIAAVNGPCGGAGYVLALASDIRIASELALFHHVYLRRALVASGETWYLPRLIGLGPALYHLLTADAIDAREALRLNLVSKVVPSDRLMDETMSLAEKLAQGPPIATRFTKKAIYQGLNWDMEQTMDYIGYARVVSAAAGEYKEGRDAFLEKRTPRW